MNGRGVTNQTVLLGTFLADCRQAARRLAASLRERGLTVVQTFDLQVARSSNATCHCPRHGRSDCTCQMVVLLAYGENRSAPWTLILHGSEDRTQVSLVQDPPGARPEPIASWVQQLFGRSRGVTPKKRGDL